MFNFDLCELNLEKLNIALNMVQICVKNTKDLGRETGDFKKVKCFTEAACCTKISRSLAIEDVFIFIYFKFTVKHIHIFSARTQKFSQN